MQDDIQQALEVLRRGGVILYPTDTVWGLGCDATNATAVERIYKIKQRDDSKSMLVLLDQANRLPSYISEIPDLAYDLIEMATSPLTIIYSGARNLSANLVSEDNTIGIRIASDDFCKKLIAAFRKPIVSTSANISGKPTPAIFDEISDEIKSAVDYIVKWRQDDLTKSRPSSIIGLKPNGEIKIIRA
jgi:L-threonylcarbamoyladenylate synthase